MNERMLLTTINVILIEKNECVTTMIYVSIDVYSSYISDSI